MLDNVVGGVRMALLIRRGVNQRLHTYLSNEQLFFVLHSKGFNLMQWIGAIRRPNMVNVINLGASPTRCGGLPQGFIYCRLSFLCILVVVLSDSIELGHIYAEACSTTSASPTLEHHHHCLELLSEFERHLSPTRASTLLHSMPVSDTYSIASWLRDWDISRLTYRYR